MNERTKWRSGNKLCSMCSESKHDGDSTQPEEITKVGRELCV
jgi:hypothetical protein